MECLHSMYAYTASTGICSFTGNCRLKLERRVGQAILS